MPPKAYNGNEPFLFISYSHKDSDEVYPIITSLQEQGFRIWFDEGIDPGSEFAAVITDRLEKCSFYVTFLSNHFYESRYCRGEINYAHESGKPILNIYLRDEMMPGEMRIWYGIYQSIHKYKYDDPEMFYQKLMETKNIQQCMETSNTAAADADPREQEKQALEQLTALAEQGNAGAMYHLAKWLLFGDFVDKDEEKGAAWLRKAAELGHAEAQTFLGECCLSGEVYPIVQDDTQAIAWLRKAAEQGNSAAQQTLGQCYLFGKGTETDIETGLAWIQKAAGQNNPYAQLYLGECYLNGIVMGIPRDEEKGAAWIRKAAEHNITDAMFILGECYLTGRGIEPDASKGCAWLERAAEKGDEVAQYKLGQFYLSSTGPERDEAKGVKWLQKSAQHGYPWAQLQLGKWYLSKESENDRKQGLPWIYRAAEQGNAMAQCCLGQLFEEGLQDKADLTEARRWYQKAAEQGNQEAKAALERLGV